MIRWDYGRRRRWKGEWMNERTNGRVNAKWHICVLSATKYDKPIKTSNKDKTSKITVNAVVCDTDGEGGQKRGNVSPSVWDHAISPRSNCQNMYLLAHRQYLCNQTITFSVVYWNDAVHRFWSDSVSQIQRANKFNSSPRHAERCEEMRAKIRCRWVFACSQSDFTLTWLRERVNV